MSDGAIPNRRVSAMSRPATFESWAITLMRKAAPLPNRSNGSLISAVRRRVRSEPKLNVPAMKRLGCGYLYAWLTTPPVVPRPNVTDDGPRSTSTCSILKGSR